MENVLRFIKENEIPIVIIPEDRKYWLVRTQSGEFYDEFFHDGFIGIGWNEFSDIERLRTSEKEEITDLISITYKPEEGQKPPQPGRIYGQIYRFLFELKVNDIVMIPSNNSSHISFGIIQSEPYIEEVSETSMDMGLCPFTKRRKVKWIKTVQRDRLDPYLYRMMQAHQAISNANDYANYIDRTLHSYYLKGNKSHLVVDVKQENQIPAVDMISYVSTLLDIVPLIENPENPEETFSKEDVDLKLNVQSPGIMEFISDSPYVVTVLGIVIVGLVGGSFKIKRTNGQKDSSSEVELQSEGLFEKVFKFIKHKDEHKLKEIKQQHTIYKDKLQAELPKEITEKLDQ
ncbi:hypothetical protein BK131_04690 [Paenibacillus amylolyticus]|uniref:Uncharacterized protein n=1 Tax=Paenibacillus amylolyticus TaxID=1451 RepID=A0A1R1C577_PAEAM|nr:hypothetical protein [Paenibacillus amylolyticus]OMF17265.1 hypothetical protein BK131_04690 [Paenibacillus amylolyticus]